jgi:D-alanine-D-alanine ligase
VESRKVAFIFGGPGHEHEVSCATAKSALPKFNAGFRVCPIFIHKDRKWVVHDGYVDPADAWEIAESLQTMPGLPADVALDEIDARAPDCVFIGLHGEYGEDGTIQAILESRGMPYTGSDADASALAIDKPKVLQLLQDEGISVPDFLELVRALGGKDAKEFIDFHGYPVVILPADSGSSIGVHLVRNQEELDSALNHAWKQSERCMISNYISGQEVSCGLLVTGKTTLIALPPTQILPSSGHDLFDFEAKYTTGETEEITPPRMDGSIIEKIQFTAKRVHQLVGADGYSRVDMIICDGEPYVLEINTLPGLTSTSILPQEASAVSISFSQLLTYICDAVDTSGSNYATAVTD